MSYFAFKRDDDGKILVTDQDILEAVEIVINQLILLNNRVEEEFQTNIEEDDIDAITR
jgi:hypothetical protein|tara:strand:+ start:688 stop:861 length:174 start_codon:yes stop_codon:yes gene_type:complete